MVNKESNLEKKQFFLVTEVALVQLNLFDQLWIQPTVKDFSFLIGQKRKINKQFFVEFDYEILFMFKIKGHNKTQFHPEV